MKLASVVVSMLIAAAVMQASPGERSTHARAPLPPTFSVAPASLNFGDVNTGSNKVDSLVVTNTGTSTMTISTISSTNTQFTVTPQTGSIAAAASKTFYVTFTPTSAGTKTAGIVFRTNATPNRDTVAVTGNGVGATLEPLFSVAPASLALGDVPTGSTKTDSVFVTNTGTLSLVLSQVYVSSGFTITPGTATLAPAASRKFTLTFAPIVPGPRSGFIYFNHNATSKKDSIPISANAVGDTARPAFSVAPSSLAFGTVATGSSKTDSLFVTNTGTLNLTITSVQSNNARFTITPGNATIAPAATRKFTVTFSPTVPGALSGRYLFNHNAGGRKDSVMYTGTGSGDPVAPKFAAAPADSLVFGDVNPGGSKQDSIIVSNAGTATLTVSSTSSSNPRFTITGGGGGGSIAPGASRKYTVTFSPNAEGYQGGYVYFNHNAASKKDSVRVAGNGSGAALAPVFAAAAQSIDFGDVTNGQTKKDSVKVTNAGTAALSITSVVSTLGLYTVAPTTATLQPNASRMFVVTFAPMTGGPKPALLIFSHNAATKKDTLTLNGNGTGTDIAPHFTNAPSMLDFGTVNTGATLVDSIIVTNTGNAGLTISNTSSTNARFTVTPRNATIAASAKRAFMITFAPTTPGEQRGFIRFPHNGTPAMDSVEVVGIGSGAAVEPVFAAAPAALAFGLVDTGTIKADSIRVTNTGTQSLSILSASSDNGRFTVTPQIANIAPAASRMFAVTFRPTQLGPQNANIIFVSNAASSPDTVAVTGTGSAATQSPNFTVTPSTLRFGYVETPKTKLDSVVVTNTGRAQLVVGDVSSDNDQFTVTPKTATIEPSSSATFRVVYAPAGPNRAQGLIVFSHNAPSATDTVSVLGNDVLPSMISTARSQPAGTEVIVEGIVTRAKGSNLRMQDGSGGLTVRQTSGAFRDAIASGFLKMGDMLRVWGKISEVTGLKQIAQAEIISFERLSRDHILPDPVQLTLPEVASTGEQYESMLIRVVDLTITPGTDTAFIASKSYQIKDPVDSTHAVVLRIPAATDTENAGRKIPSTKAVFTGVLGQVATTDPAKGYQLLPVLLGDLTAPDPTGVDDATAVPVSTSLLGSYPNPFSPATRIAYALAAQSRVTLRVYSALGREIATLVDGVTESGTYSATWNGTDAAGLRVPAGIYLCRFTAEPLEAGARSVTHTRTLVLVR